jgi:uncharacterized protein (TIGR02597 family)
VCFSILSSRLPVVTLLCGLLVGAIRVHATEVVADPAGYLILRVAPQSDVPFSVPAHREAAFEGAVQSVAGSVVTLQQPPAGLGWTLNQWTSAPHYLLVGGGALEGAWFTVTGSSPLAVTVDTRGTSLATLTAGTVVRLVPHWTLASLFPGNSGVTTTTSISGLNAGTTILQTEMAAGTNLAAAIAYYYYSGTGSGGPGWRRKGAAFATIFDQAIVPPGAFLTYRNATAATAEFMLNGSVQLAAHRAAVKTLTANVAQDNPLGLSAATAQSLATLNLLAGGAMLPTGSITGVDADELLVFEDPISGFNPAASASYFYYNGVSSGGPGWRRKGGVATTLFDSVMVFQPGHVVIVRKAAAPTSGSVDWKFLPAYLH